jgi:hypothetical protein
MQTANDKHDPSLTSGSVVLISIHLVTPLLFDDFVLTQPHQSATPPDPFEQFKPTLQVMVEDSTEDVP